MAEVIHHVLGGSHTRASADLVRVRSAFTMLSNCTVFTVIFVKAKFLVRCTSESNTVQGITVITGLSSSLLGVSEQYFTG